MEIITIEDLAVDISSGQGNNRRNGMDKNNK
jgi:hypothetical protein